MTMASEKCEIESLNENGLDKGVKNNTDKDLVMKTAENNNNESAPLKTEFEHYDVSSFFMNFILHNLNENVDTLIRLQGNARKFFESFIQEEQDVGWRTCSHSRFVVLPGVDLLVKLPDELRSLKGGNERLYETLALNLRTLMIWVGLKFEIMEDSGDQMVIKGYLFCKAEYCILQKKLTVLVPRNVDDIVPLLCIGSEMVAAALKAFTKLLTVTSYQLSEHEALPKRVVDDFNHPDFDPDEEIPEYEDLWNSEDEVLWDMDKAEEATSDSAEEPNSMEKPLDALENHDVKHEEPTEKGAGNETQDESRKEQELM